MGQSTGRTRSRRLRLRRWPEAVLALLAASALGAPLSDRSSPGFPVFLTVWMLGALAAAAAPLFRGKDARALSAADEVRLLLLALLALHLTIAHTGGASSPWLPAYGIVVVIAAARIPGWWPPLLFFLSAAVLEAGPPVLAGLVRDAPLDPAAALAPLLPGFALLALLALLAGWFFGRSRRERDALRSVVAEHRRLHEEAKEFSALGEYREPEVASLTPESRKKRMMGAVVDLDPNLDRVLGLTSRALGARSVFLFLLADDGEHLGLRRAVEAEGTTVDRDIAMRLGEGLIGHAARTRRPALFTNLETGSLRPALYTDETPVSSLMVVPVNEHGVFRGVLVVDAGEPGVFGRGHERLLEDFAGEVGALLENARDDARHERHSLRFETLRYLSQAFSSTIKLDEILAKMVKIIHKIVPYDRCALFLVDQERRRLVLKAQQGFLDHVPEELGIRLDQEIPGYIASHGRALLFSNLRERRRSVQIVPGAPGQERIRSFLGVPIRLGDAVTGVWVLTAEEPGRFTAEHLELLGVVADQAAILLSNAALHQQVERMAVTDGLTGLYNHRHFQERLQHEVERADRTREPVSLLLLDIDHFKKINDTCGHPFGDTVIKALAAELGRLARRVDFVARYGGEEFAVILVNTNRKGCRTTAQRVLQAVQAIRVPREGQAFSFTVSIGAATCPDDAKTREDLVRCADQALYAAKAGGRNRVKVFGEIGA